MSLEERLTQAVEHMARLTTQLAKNTEREDQRIHATLESQTAILRETQTLRSDMAREQARPITIPTDPHFPTFRQTAHTIQEWLQQVEERAVLLQLSEPTKVLYAKLAMPEQSGHLHGVTKDTTWDEFKVLVIAKFEPRHAIHDLIKRIRALRMHRTDLQSYINEFERLKRLLPSENQTDLDMMYTFINGLTDELRIKLMSKEEVKTYEQATQECWRYYMSKGYGQDEYRALPDSSQPMELDRRARTFNRYSRQRSRSRSYSHSRHPKSLNSYNYRPPYLSSFRSNSRSPFRSRSRSNSRKPSYRKSFDRHRPRSRSHSTHRHRTFSRSRSRSFSNSSRRFNRVTPRARSRSHSHSRNSRSPRRHSHISHSRSPHRKISHSPHRKNSHSSHRSKSPTRLRAVGTGRSPSPHKDHTRKCFTCGDPTHLAADCPKKKSYPPKKFHSMERSEITSSHSTYKDHGQEGQPKPDFPRRW